MVDPRLNCAAEICCSPAGTSATNTPADKALVEILRDLGLDAATAEMVCHNMRQKRLVLLSAELATAIREIAFPGG